MKTISNFLSRNIFWLILLVFGFFAGLALGRNADISLGVGNDIAVTFGYSGAPSYPPSGIDFTPLWTAWSMIDSKYVDTATSSSSKAVSNEERVFGAVSGMVASLGDPYTVFLPPEEAKIFQTGIDGSFEGVGMEIGLKDSILTVVAPLEGTPAKKAGIKAGDKILKIDDLATIGMTIEKAVGLIRGPRGTTVNLLVERAEGASSVEVSIVRDVIEIPTLELGGSENGVRKENASGNGLRDDGVFVMRLFNFSAKSPELFREAIKKFVLSGSGKLILDLRGNPGGFLDASVEIASWFLPAGKVVVKEVQGKSGQEKIYRSRGYDIFTDKLKMVILIDGGSASASEILAGALSDHGVATLIGKKTFGKGSVQELQSLTENTLLKLTIAKWLTPSGNSISLEGLKPDIEVERTEDDFEKENDPQFYRAIEFLLKGE